MFMNVHATFGLLVSIDSTCAPQTSFSLKFSVHVYIGHPWFLVFGVATVGPV